MSQISQSARAGLTIVFAAALAALGMRQLRPPDALPTDAPLGEFSGMRALGHLRAFARRPHPFGSPAQEVVRAYVVQQLTALGVDAQVESLPVTRDARGGYPLAAGITHNVIARIPGTSPSAPLLLLGHYDSVPGGPGAADDGEGVSVLLETVRALRSGAPLRNDLIFLFTDGEEAGLLGAKSYVDAHPANAGLALNFEARGTSGPGMMFATSTDNGWMVRQLASAAPDPVANSLSYAVYQLLPNDTDLTVFRHAGFASMDFAFIGDVTNYHTRIDDVSHIDPRSLQHQGSYALSLARRFGNLDLRHVTAPDVTYFNFPTLGVVIYPIAWSLPLACLAAVLLLAALAYGLTRRRITAGGLLVGFFALLFGLAAGVAAAIGLWKLVLAWHPDFRQMLQGDPYHAWIYRIASTALVVAVFAALYRLVRRRIAMAALWAGALSLWLLLSIVTAIALPGASYAFTWPLLFAIAGFGFLVASDGNSESWSGTAIWWACAVPAVVMTVPLIHQLFVAMTMAMAAPPAVFTVLLLGLLIPIVEMISAPRNWWLPTAALLVCVACLIGGVPLAGFDADHPKPDSLFYGLDVATNKAYWLSGDSKPDSWALPALGAQPSRIYSTPFIPFLKWPMLVNSAAIAPLPAPVFDILENTRDGDVRTLRLRIASPRRADDIFVYGDPSAEVIAAQVNGKSVGPDLRAPDDKVGLKMLDLIRFKQWSFEYFAPPPEGFELQIKVRSGSAPLRMVLVDQSYGLDGVGAPPRPANTMPLPWLTDSVYVRQSFQLP
jgi:hypothetical protein